MIANRIGGLVGNSTNASVLTASTGKENVYVTDSVVNMSANSGAGAVVSKQVGNGADVTGVTYSALITGSTSGYADGSYGGQGNTSAAGKYDMINDLPAEAVCESPRLIDIIKIYVLLYTKSLDSVNNVYTISNSSKLIGSALGTTGSPIVINNQQQVAYLREFRFATFTLARDIDMYTAYNAGTAAGAFYGTVNAGSYKINLRARENAKMFQVELSGHALPLKIDSQE